MTPVLSIIVPTYNAASVLPDLMRSMSSQSYRDFEVIVSDGVSRDCTESVVERFRESLPSLSYYSRKDQGVYDAINFGVRKSVGQWFLVLGADDRLAESDVLYKIGQVIDGNASGNVVDDANTCATEWFYGDVRLTNCLVSMGAQGQRYAGEFDLAKLLGRNICQQAVVYSRALFESLGGFDLRFSICADWDFHLRAYSISKPVWIDLIVADYAANGLSSRVSDIKFLAARRKLLRSLMTLDPANPELRGAITTLIKDGWYELKHWNFAHFYEFTVALIKICAASHRRLFANAS